MHMNPTKKGCQFGYLSHASLQHHFERLKLKLCQKKRLYEGIRFDLVATM